MTSPDTNDWQASAYDQHCGFVSAYGEGVLEWLDPQSGERILDVGCGTGHLTAEIAGRAGEAVGIDQSAEMIAEARREHPDPTFESVDARALETAGFDANESFDAVFSNAALHWIPDADHDDVLAAIQAALVPSGRFVAEMGGRGNVSAITAATVNELDSRGYDVEHPWYFPSIGEYTPRLEASGLEVQRAVLFDRPTTLDGEDGLRNWLDVFGDSLFAALSEDERMAVVTAVEDRLREQLFDPESDSWTAGYRRLRFLAVNESQ